MVLSPPSSFVEIVCFNADQDRGKDYVEILYDSVIRNLPEGYPGKFICYTDDPEAYAEGIEKRPLSGPLPRPNDTKIIVLPLNICIVGALDDIVNADGLYRDINDLKNQFPDLFSIYQTDITPKGSIVEFPLAKPHQCKGDWVEHIWKRGGSFVSAWKIVGNVADEVIKSNIINALSTDCEILADQYMVPTTTRLLIVGGGPSLADDIGKIRLMQQSGCIVWALNNTFRYLCEHGIEPQAHLLLDARAENSAFVPQSTSALMLYSAQCHPDVISRGMRAGKVIIWCPAVEGVLEILKEKKIRAAIIEGGSSVGMKALALAQAFGFKHLHLFGYDSSYRDDKDHAYPQPLNANDRVVDVTVNDRTFKCAPWMASQVEEFKASLGGFLAAGMEFTIHGDGLLPYTTRVVNQPIVINGKMHVNYDLSRCPPTWNFFEWMMNIQFVRRNSHYPPLEIFFKKGPIDGFRENDEVLSAAEKQHMLDNVCRALLPIFGATEAQTAGVDVSVPYTLRLSVEEYKKNPVLPPLTLMPDAEAWAKAYQDVITITLREASHHPERNSDLMAWLRFAKTLDKRVIFIRDTAKAHELLDGFESCPEASFNVTKRHALYRAASLNFFVSNGPSLLAICDQKINYVCFIKVSATYNVNTQTWWQTYLGIKMGEQWPWATPAQRMILAQDIYDNIKSAYIDLLQANIVNDIDDEVKGSIHGKPSRRSYFRKIQACANRFLWRRFRRSGDV